ncbi:hypothetical protein D3C84_188280 [compost metagenome]
MRVNLEGRPAGAVVVGKARLDTQVLCEGKPREHVIGHTDEQAIDVAWRQPDLSQGSHAGGRRQIHGRQARGLADAVSGARHNGCLPT